MVKVTTAYIVKAGCKNASKNPKDRKDYLLKLTHLRLNDQFVDAIGDISACKNLKVLYLQNNQLEKVENLVSSLTHLYLQRNKLNKIQGFEGLVSLQKLYLGHNLISVVEGLEKLKCLQELHIENQKLCAGEELVFDPRTIAALGPSLQILNIQSNNLTSLEDLVGLDALKTLIVANNNLLDVTKIQAFLSAVPTLMELDMRNNPVVQNYRNCDRILASAQNLRVFNEKQIPVTTLDFMKKFEAHQQKAMACRPQRAPNDLIKSISELTYNLPDALAKDVTSSILHDAGFRETKLNRKTDGVGVASELALFAEPDGPFFHFPAFKSSTCLEYEGHTVPKPLYRQIILDAQLQPKQRPSLKLKTDWPTTISLKKGTILEDRQHEYAANFAEVNSGDMMWGNKIADEPCSLKTGRLKTRKKTEKVVKVL